MRPFAHSTSGHGQPAAFLHGFTQTRESWHPFLRHLTYPLAATLIDAPDHGDSRGVNNLNEVAHTLSAMVPQNILVGYSMGARMSLVTATLFPDLFPRLILISGTAGIDSESERQERRDSDERLASHIEDIGVSAFISEWLSMPMFSGLNNENAQIPQRLTNSAHGLAASLRTCGTGTQEPLWEKLNTLKMPVLLVAGEKDDKFCEIAHRMNESLPNSTLHIHPHVGHTVHLEDAQGCAEVVSDWLQRTESHS